jgi:predicted neuraminidase
MTAFKYLPLLLLLAYGALILSQPSSQHADTPLGVNLATGTGNPLPQFQSQLIGNDFSDFVHAPSIAETQDGNMLMVCFSGSREGAGDVEIIGYQFEAAAGDWHSLPSLAQRDQTARDTGRHIRKLGNPVVARAPDGRLWLFYVSVSVGGWAGSAINARWSDNGGHSWSPASRLINTPFFNISTLVKGTPLFMSDGTVMLPVYQEFLGKFSEVMHISTTGEVQGKGRISAGRHSLQPVLLPLDTGTAALMRYAGDPPRRVLRADGQLSGPWSTPEKLQLPNPNAAITALRRPAGDWLAVANNLEKGRYELSLLRSNDEGRSWQEIATLESHDWGEEMWVPRDKFIPQLKSDAQREANWDMQNWEQFQALAEKRLCDGERCKFMYDYPYMVQASDGDYHVVYTWNKSHIKHLAFNEAWVDQQLGAQP